MRNKIVAFTVSAETARKLVEIAKAEERSESWLVSKAVDGLYETGPTIEWPENKRPIRKYARLTQENHERVRLTAESYEVSMSDVIAAAIERSIKK